MFIFIKFFFRNFHFIIFKFKVTFNELVAERPDLSVKEARDYLIELNEARNEHLQSALAARRGNSEKKMRIFFDTLMLNLF